ncbi:hypothetical protein E4630_12110 [Aeromonas hydrophila]|uniref:hypothetical protein n=1 Tax=Aeromonas hydrophila TaxID=644 RepID=UPI00107E712E|nr:hypothetical protein [Aeromonas hydrophila]QBX71544.1 hypothetical protein E4625_12330 [Aeromonas hydrophila]QBX76244.1 hypothetical protein E4630_12110 [Aeromonas hydrophila]
MKILDRFGLKPKKLEIEFDGEKQEFFAKPISYNLAVFIANEFDDNIRKLVIVRHCLCEEDGTMVFEEDTDLEVIGDQLPYEAISLMALEIAKSSGPKARGDELVKKPVV